MTTVEKVACKCQHCNLTIQFEPERAGEMIACPKCGLETQLFIPAQSSRAALPPPPPRRRNLDRCDDCGYDISTKAVICPNCGALPSLGRIAWYVLVITGVMALISAIVAFLLHLLSAAIAG